MTIDRDHEQLIQEVLDGTASPAEVERLEAWLTLSETGRTRMRELEGIFTALERVPAAEPPAGLRNEVLNALQSRARGPAPSRPRLLRHSWFGPRARLATVFAAGIAAGAMVMGMVRGVIPPMAPGAGTELTGAMMPARAPAGSITRNLTAGQARVEAVTWQVGDARHVALSFAGEGPAELELTYDPARLSPGSLQQSPPVDEVRITPGRVLVRGRSRGGLALDFSGADPGAVVHLELRSAGAQARGELPLPGAR